MRWLAAATRDGREHRAGARDEDESQAQSQHEPPARGGVSRCTQAVERELDPVADGGQQEAGGEDEEETDPEPEQEVLRQSDGAQDRAAD